MRIFYRIGYPLAMLLWGVLMASNFIHISKRVKERSVRLAAESAHHPFPPPNVEIWCDDSERYVPIWGKSETDYFCPANPQWFTNRQDAIDRAWYLFPNDIITNRGKTVTTDRTEFDRIQWRNCDQ